jgi:hypothetical protein
MLQSIERSRFLGKRGETVLVEILGEGRRRHSRSRQEIQSATTWLTGVAPW